MEPRTNGSNELKKSKRPWDATEHAYGILVALCVAAIAVILTFLKLWR
jgi:hypothetical protein